MYIYIHIYTYICTYIYICIHLDIYICIYICICMYTHTHLVCSKCQHFTILRGSLQISAVRHKCQTLFTVEIFFMLRSLFMSKGLFTYMIGCNNGGGGDIFSKKKRLVRKYIGTRKRLFSRISSLLPYECEILETQELLTRSYFTHKTTYSNLSLFMSYLNTQENLDSDLFWASDGRVCGDFSPFCVFARLIKSCHFVYCS